jgi:hypothetical protein
MPPVCTIKNQIWLPWLQEHNFETNPREQMKHKILEDVRVTSYALVQFLKPIKISIHFIS